MKEAGDKGKLVVISGPTAVGKSRLAAELGRAVNGEVISADSMQVYRYMDIGSAKVTKEEMLGVPHHMLDVADPKEAMDASRYKTMAEEWIRDVQSRGRLPIVCGGTGFYIQALVRDIDFTETRADQAKRSELEAFAKEKGPEALHARLRELDPASADAIHPNNVKRVIRAIEYFSETGSSIAEHNEKEREKKSPYDLIWFLIEDERSRLYERIDRRVDFMLEEGLIDEVRYLKAMGLGMEDVSMQGIGYKEVLAYLDGQYDEAEMIRLIKRNSRHYAKRQLTWFRNREETIRLTLSDFDGDIMNVFERMLQIVQDRFDLRPDQIVQP